MSKVIITSYFDYNPAYKHFYAVDNLSIISLNLPPKEPDVAYCKKLVYEVFEFFGLDQYISSLVWEEAVSSDLIYKWMPIVHFKFFLDEEYIKKCRAIYNDLCSIVGHAWSKGY